MKSCPQCHLLLEDALWEETLLAVCRSCGGIWFPRPALAESLRVRRDRFPALDALYPGVASIGMFAGLRLPCPECRADSLERLPLPDLPEALADQCTRCGGVWLRAGERAALSGQPPAVATSAPPSPPPAAPEAAASEPAVRLPFALAAPDAETVLRDLMEGNRRFTTDRLQHQRQAAERRAEIAPGQRPRALVIGCADSRIPPEIVFDQGLGDLFVVRLAGHALSAMAEGSVVYGVEKFDIPLVLVVGHEGCSAVRAALDADPKTIHPYLVEIMDAIRPAVRASLALPGDPFENAVKANVRREVAQLKQQPLLAERIAARSLAVLGAYYALESGVVTLLPPEADLELHPAEEPSHSVPSAAVVNTAAALIPALAPSSVLSLPPAVSAATPDGETLTPPNAAWARLGRLVSRLPKRWCPQCRRGYQGDVSFCPQCRVGLATPSFQVLCTVCQRTNEIQRERCVQCGTDLHPEGMDG